MRIPVLVSLALLATVPAANAQMNPALRSLLLMQNVQRNNAGSQQPPQISRNVDEPPPDESATQPAPVPNPNAPSRCYNQTVGTQTVQRCQ